MRQQAGAVDRPNDRLCDRGPLATGLENPLVLLSRRSVGKGAYAPCPPFLHQQSRWARYALPTLQEAPVWTPRARKTCIITNRRTATASSTTPSTPSSRRARSG